MYVTTGENILHVICKNNKGHFNSFLDIIMTGSLKLAWLQIPQASNEYQPMLIDHICKEAPKTLRNICKIKNKFSEKK
jgi:hypothetical protein